MRYTKILIIFVLPVISSLLFGSVVMADILQNSNKKLNDSPIVSNSSNTTIEILGLSEQYSVNQPVQIQVRVLDSSLNCGDLYVTIYSSSGGAAVSQNAFFNQCFEAQNNTVPVGEQHSSIIDTPGSYKIEAQMVSSSSNVLTTGAFIVQ